MKKNVKKIAKSFQDIKFDTSLITVLLAALIILISFLVYSSYSMKTPTEEIEDILFGDECTVDADCQPRCPGIKGICDRGYCLIEELAKGTVRCIDLQMPVCGNRICEAEEEGYCPDDCELQEEVLVCNNDGLCEQDLIDDGYNQNEDSDNCPNDCYCGDGICDQIERMNYKNCEEDCVYS